MKNIQLNALLFHQIVYDKVNTNFYSLAVLEKAAECESFAIISFDPLVAYKTNITFNYF